VHSMPPQSGQASLQLVLILSGISKNALIDHMISTHFLILYLCARQPALGKNTFRKIWPETTLFPKKLFALK
jgi:hypothetical protein